MGPHDEKQRQTTLKQPTSSASGTPYFSTTLAMGSGQSSPQAAKEQVFYPESGKGTVQVRPSSLALVPRTPWFSSLPQTGPASSRIDVSSIGSEWRTGGLDALLRTHSEVET
jgi:hypothetical protein